MGRLGPALGLLLLLGAGGCTPDLIVVDAFGEPVAGAEVIWSMPSFDQRGWTDVDGEASHAWNPMWISVEKAGYRPVFQHRVQGVPRPWRLVLMGLPLKPRTE